MTVEAHDPRSKKVQIADALRDEIASTPLPAGHRLASLRDLADRFKVTTVTVGNALKVLADEGVIISVPTRGYFVQDRPSEDGAGQDASAPVSRDEINAIHSEIQQLAARVAELEKRTQPLSGT
ncbi:winged helix-turn-helix domain-containing protein [Streptomyces sp. NBC_00154]|uniref:winged helix-turn-helix domain-containing protein n=1 Tax=Streptomyces sp. NBC_00154 TaxID=2975670 RepID=UPI0022532A1B|nr:winged helix-turn-helix domain-containing protein [Streptomyces sp. NBC_00154]MCX5313146.1 winged helix-turn-helix domain-containing protein [Streptomyces sp. NBC_00154]